MRDLAGSVGPAACKPRAGLSSCPPQPVPCCCSAALSPRCKRHRWQVLTLEEKSLSPDLGHRVEVRVASVGHVPPEPAERCPGEQRGAVSPGVPHPTDCVLPQRPQQKTTGCIHLFLTFDPGHACTGISRASLGSLEPDLCQTWSLGHRGASLGVMRGHAPRLPAGVRAELPAPPGGTAQLSAALGTRTQKPSRISLQRLEMLLL